MIEPIVTLGGLSALFLAGILQIIRLARKDNSYMFPVWVYTLSLPVLNVLMIPVGALLELEGVAMPTDWISWVRVVIVVLLASLVSLLGYAGSSSIVGSYRASYTKYAAKARK